MEGFNWSKDKDGIISVLSTYFGLSHERIDTLINENFALTNRYGYPTADKIRNRERLIAVVNALTPYCTAGKPAYVDGLPQANIKYRIKSAEAILSCPKFSDDETPVQTYHRLTNLYKSISEKGIDIYKTIYTTSLTDGDYGAVYDRENGKVVRYLHPDRIFKNVYDTLQNELRLSKEETNSLVEKCAATVISKISQSRISAMYKQMMSLRLLNDEKGTCAYIFKRDREFECVMDKTKHRSRMLDEGLINCPTIFTCKPEKVASAFKYIERKIPAELIEQEYQKFQSIGNTTMTKFWCKYSIMRKWINNNFSLLTINDENMNFKESILHNIAISLNDRGYHGGKNTYYSFKFLFNNPLSISTINSISEDDLKNNARKNILTLERYTNEAGVVDYIKRNHYVLAMNNEKLETLLRKITEFDAENPESLCMQRFFILGKSLFGSKHCIKFDVEPTFKRLAKIQEIQILNVNEMDDWTKLSSFIGLFCGNDQSFFNNIQRLYCEKLLKDRRGNLELRKQIRTFLTEHGGWDEILKDKKRVLSVITEIKSMTNKRFVVEQIKKTEDIVEDIAVLQAKEDAFSSAIKGVLSRVRNAYTANRDKLIKKFTDIDKLYESTIEFLSEKCFDDKEPISTLVEEELRTPFIDSLKKIETTNVNPQQSLFGAETVEVSAPNGMYPTLKKLTQELSRDAYYKVETDVVKISRSKDGGKS